MIPIKGMIHVLKAAATKAGLATQTMNSANRGKSPANRANRQPILHSLHTPCFGLESQSPDFRENRDLRAYEFLRNFLNRFAIFARVLGSSALRSIFLSRSF